MLSVWWFWFSHVTREHRVFICSVMCGPDLCFQLCLLRGFSCALPAFRGRLHSHGKQPFLSPACMSLVDQMQKWGWEGKIASFPHGVAHVNKVCLLKCPSSTPFPAEIG